MSKNARGTRDGSGPHRDSYQRRTHKVGKRQQQGVPCPKK